MFPRSSGFIALLRRAAGRSTSCISFVTSGPADRERVPYQPFFVDQVKAGNVKEISSQEDSIEGELKQARRPMTRPGTPSR